MRSPSRIFRVSLLAIALFSIGSGGVAFADGEFGEETFEDGVKVFEEVVFDGTQIADGHVGSGLRSTIPVGGHWGSSGHWIFESHGLTEPEEMWWRYYVRFADDFYIQSPNRGKLPGPANLNGTPNCRGNKPSTSSQPCWSARMLFSRNYDGTDVDGKTLIGFYVYNVDSPPTRGHIWTWDEDVAYLDNGEWYCVEGKITLNTPGVADGTLLGFVDGAQAYENNEVFFRRAAEGGIDIRSFWFDVYYGGEESATHNIVDFDSLALGPTRQGCDDGLPTSEAGFVDTVGSVFEADIDKLAFAGITQGCNPPVNDQYCPDNSVNRGQMAAFLVRAFDLDGTHPGFNDTAGNIFEVDIGKLAAADVTKGCNPPVNDEYCPNVSVTRGQMAAFLVRALELTGPGPTFTDTAGSIYEQDIGKLAAAGITLGCNPPVNDKFCPNVVVTRGQMAAFLVRALGL